MFAVFYHGRHFTDDCGRFDSYSQAWSYVHRVCEIYNLSEADFTVEQMVKVRLALV